MSNNISEVNIQFPLRERFCQGIRRGVPSILSARVELYTHVREFELFTKAKPIHATTNILIPKCRTCNKCCQAGQFLVTILFYRMFDHPFLSAPSVYKCESRVLSFFFSLGTSVSNLDKKGKTVLRWYLWLCRTSFSLPLPHISHEWAA